MENDKTEEEQQHTSGGWDDAQGYCAIVQAASSIAIGGTVDEHVRQAADRFLISEFKRWANYDLGGESS